MRCVATLSDAFKKALQSCVDAADNFFFSRRSNHVLLRIFFVLLAENKVGMVGDAQVGKTTLMVKYVENKFDEEYIMTLGEYCNAGRRQESLDVMCFTFRYRTHCTEVGSGQQTWYSTALQAHFWFHVCSTASSSPRRRRDSPVMQRVTSWLKCFRGETNAHRINHGAPSSPH